MGLSYAPSGALAVVFLGFVVACGADESGRTALAAPSPAAPAAAPSSDVDSSARPVDANAPTSVSAVPSAIAQGGVPRPRPVSDGITARVLADEAARRHVLEIETAHRAVDPKVRLNFPEDYRVSVREVPDPSRDDDKSPAKAFMVSYDFRKQNVGFLIWLGDGMHFDVFVRESDGRVDLVGGE